MAMIPNAESAQVESRIACSIRSTAELKRYFSCASASRVKIWELSLRRSLRDTADFGRRDRKISYIVCSAFRSGTKMRGSGNSSDTDESLDSLGGLTAHATSTIGSISLGPLQLVGRKNEQLQRVF